MEQITRTKNNKLGLAAKTFPKRKQWQVDQDYHQKLSESEKVWLSKFNDEYYGGSVRKDDPTAIHNSPELRRDCYSRNNSINRDQMSIAVAMGVLESDVASFHNEDGEQETSRISLIPDMNTLIDVDSFEFKKRVN